MYEIQPVKKFCHGIQKEHKTPRLPAELLSNVQQLLIASKRIKIYSIVFLLAYIKKSLKSFNYKELIFRRY